MPRTVQIREIPDITYQRLAQRAAAAGMTVPEYFRRLAERDLARPTAAEWLERTRLRGGPQRESDVIGALDELRGAWPA